MAGINRDSVVIYRPQEKHLIRGHNRRSELDASASQTYPGGQPRYRRGGPFVLANLSIGHGFTHWYGQSIVVLLPVIQTALGFTNFQFGALIAILSISGGIANIPAGFVVDIFRRRWGLMLTLCMALAAVGYGLVAASPGFVILALVFLILPLPGTVWHMPAIAAISQRFPARRGFSLSMHGVGGQVGDSIGPLIVGALLTLFAGAWRPVALVYVFPAVVMTGVVFWALFHLGGEGDDAGQRTEVGQRFRDAGRLLRSPAILALVLVSSFRDMGSVVLMFWLAKYLHDPVADGGLGFSAFMVGVHLTLLLILGVVSSPIAGLMSDRFGRKLILIPCLTAVGLLSLAIEPAGAGILLMVIVLAIGLFSSSMNQILQATVLDQVGRGTEGVTMGIVMWRQQRPQRGRAPDSRGGGQQLRYRLRVHLCRRPVGSWRGSTGRDSPASSARGCHKLACTEKPSPYFFTQLLERTH